MGMYSRTLVALLFAAFSFNLYGGESQADALKTGITAPAAPTSPKPENMARGRKCQIKPAPNYKLCLDNEDSLQLTDGVKYDGTAQLWTQKGCVGWEGVNPVFMTVDLGKVAPISGVSFHTAFDNRGNVPWISDIFVFVSEDGSNFHYACDLVDGDWPNLLPPGISMSSGPKTKLYEYSNKLLETKGRFVAFVVNSERFVFCDELEVYKGPDKFLEMPFTDTPVTNFERYAEKMVSRRPVQFALLSELKGVMENAIQLGLSSKMADSFTALKKQIEDYQGIEAPIVEQRAIAPLNDIHRNILMANAKVMSGLGLPTLALWNCNRWEPLSPTAIPKKDSKAALSLDLMKGEIRGEALNFTNTGDDDLKVDIRFKGIPAGMDIKAFQVEFVGVGSGAGAFVADALTPLEMSPSGCTLAIPAGMTRQLWLNCSAVDIQAGVYEGEVDVSCGLKELAKVPLKIKVHPFDFPKTPHLNLGVCDYTYKPYCFKGMTDRNIEIAIEDMKVHYVNTAWGHRKTAGWPEKGDFDKEGNLIAPLRMATFDEWIESHKGYDRFILYLGQDMRLFAGEPMGTQRFERMLSQWAAKFAEHARRKGVASRQIIFHFIDEAHDDISFKSNALYAKTVKATVPEIRVFTDNSGFETASPALIEMLGASDIICPLLPLYSKKMAEVLKVIGKAEGKKELQFYSCWGPGRLMDPYFYYRLSAWHCVKYNARGMGFWNYWNSYSGEAQTDWNELFTNQSSFGMVYKTKDSITSSKRWEAVREGVEDYEYFEMLKARIVHLKAQGVDGETLHHAEMLLVSLPDEVIAGYEGVRYNDFFVEGRGNRAMADLARIKILETLRQLDGFAK